MQIKNYFSLIKFSHTIFALPFAIVGFFLAVKAEGEALDWTLLLLVLLCMVFARSAAMAYNRYLDRDIDKRNPRTVVREIPAGIISPRSALVFVVINSLLFVLTTYFINSICFFLSPIALLIILGYSYTKRFTFLCHFILGLGLSLAPIGAYLAVVGEFHLLPILYALAVLFWVSGFDIIYALQDEAFDRSLNLKSIPVQLGGKNALLLSNILHLLCAFCMIGASVLMDQLYTSAAWLHWLATIIFLGLLFYQHRLVRPNDLSKVNLAFFTTNGVASVIFGMLIVLELYV
ncbi:MAG: UbiA-like polyprenyltransferase [Bacteroidota bacterium]